MTAPRTASHPAIFQDLRRFFRMESHRLQFPQGVRAALAISVPIGLGLAFDQLSAAVIVTLGAWLVLVTDTGGAYRQKAMATLSATAGVACAVLAASILNVSPPLIILGTFLWVATASFIGIFGNTASTVSFSTSLMFVITAALPHANDVSFRLLLCACGRALGCLPLFGAVASARVHARDRGCLAVLLESRPISWRRHVRCTVRTPSMRPQQKIRFRNRFEALMVALEKARKIWTAIRVGRAGPSARSSQLLALIENAAQLSSVAVALHEQMLLVRTHPRFSEVEQRDYPRENRIGSSKPNHRAVHHAARRKASISETLNTQVGLLEEAIERLRSATYTEIHDFSILVHIGKLSRGFKALLDC